MVCVFRTISLTCLAPHKEVPISFTDLEQFLVGCSQLEVIICLLKDAKDYLFYSFVVPLYILLIISFRDCFFHAFDHIKHANQVLLGKYASYGSYEYGNYWVIQEGEGLLDNSYIDNLENGILNKFIFLKKNHKK
jgi:hypothetical protein